MKFNHLFRISILAIFLLNLASCTKLGFEEPPDLNASGRILIWSGLEYGYNGIGIQFNQPEVSFINNTPLNGNGASTYILSAFDGSNSISICIDTDSLLLNKTYLLNGKNGYVDLYNMANTEIGVLMGGPFSFSITSCNGNVVSGSFSGWLDNLTYGGRDEVDGSFDGINIYNTNN